MSRATFKLTFGFYSCCPNHWTTEFSKLWAMKKKLNTLQPALLVGGCHLCPKHASVKFCQHVSQTLPINGQFTTCSCRSTQAVRPAASIHICYQRLTWFETCKRTKIGVMWQYIPDSRAEYCVSGMYCHMTPILVRLQVSNILLTQTFCKNF